MEDPGKQYPKDRLNDKSGFLEKARLHQSKYRALKLQVPYVDFGNYLTKEDALRGLNFYSDFEIYKEVKKRYPKYSKGLYANLLRSEHIGSNLFVPFKSDLEFGKTVLNSFLNDKIKSINRIEIEYAPSPAANYLSDKTSFDVYIEYTHTDSSKGIIGIEVKYTEREYKLKPDSKEKDDIENKDSLYFQVSNKSGLYKDGTKDLLISDRYRQVWRNQLLGESILQCDSDAVKHFTSLTIFPEANIHFREVSKEYLEMLVLNDNSFIPVTYEEFIFQCTRYCPDSRYEKWIKYLEERYIVRD